MFNYLLTDREKGFYFLIAVLLISLRFLHWSPEIDKPHVWRQCDTAYYIQDFYENGIDLLYPEVCWMGGYGVTALEFPLPEAVVAVAYHMFDADHRTARGVFLLFFIGAVFFLWKIINKLFDARIAWWTSLIFMALPISLFYSRAIHIDFTAMMFGLWGVNALLQGLESRSWRDWLLASLLFSLASMIKAPILLAMVPPIAYVFFRQPQFHRLLKYLLWMLIPIGCFVTWRIHVEHINGQAPDWSFLPGYLPIVNMGGWYFGSWEQRFDSYNWEVLLSRMSLELAGISGLVGFMLGCFLGKKGKSVLWLWIIGGIAYFLIFFPLNLNHDYYQIPLLPIIALGNALFFDFLHKKGSLLYTFVFYLPFVLFLEKRTKKSKRPNQGQRQNPSVPMHRDFIPNPPGYNFVESATGKVYANGKKGGRLFVFALLLIIIGENVARSEWTNFPQNSRFYEVNHWYIDMGQKVAEATESTDLIILSDPFQDPRNPTLMYRTHRRGWTVNLTHLSAERIQKLQADGATHLVILNRDAIPYPLETSNFLQKVPHILTYQRTVSGQNWKLEIYDLK